MLKVVLTSFFFFTILAELALDTILLLRQLVFCTYTLFGTLKIHYYYRAGRRIRRSWVRLPSPTILFFLCQMFFFFFFFHITIFMIFFPS